MERTNLTIIFANIRTSKSTYYLLYDKSHSKTQTTIIIYIPFSILLQILVSPAKKIRKTGGFSLQIGENRNRLKKKEKIGGNRNWTPCQWLQLTSPALQKYQVIIRLSYSTKISS